MPTISANLSFGSSTLKNAIELLERLSPINLRRDAVRYKVTNRILGHEFEPKLLTSPTYCSQCNDFILIGQVAACKLCKLSTHMKCMQSTSWNCLSEAAQLEQAGNFLEAGLESPPVTIFKQAQNEHKFKRKYFIMPTFCKHCGTMIMGVLDCQGLICNDKQGGCGMEVHYECEKFVHKHCFSRSQQELTAPTGERPEPWINDLVSIKDFDILKELGAGSFSKVYLAKLKSSNQEYAIKVVKKTNCVVSSDPESVLTEMRVLNLARQFPFLTIAHCCFQSEDRLYFVLEHAIGRDLLYYLGEYRKFREDWTSFYSAEIVLALDFLHSRDIIHRDLKLENVIIDKQGHCKLLDFGMSKDLARISSRRTRTFCGTPSYMSPEMLRNEEYDFSVDWWTLGVLMFELMVGDFPFNGADNVDQLYSLIVKEEIPIPHFLGHDARFILAGLLKKYPHQRLGCSIMDGCVQQLKEHPFFHQKNSTLHPSSCSVEFCVFWKEIETKRIKPPFVPTEQDLQTTARNCNDRSKASPPISQDQLKQIEQAEFNDFTFYSDSFKRMLQQN